MTIDSLFQAWLSDMKEFYTNSEFTVQDYINDCFECLQNPDEITREVIFVCNYAYEHGLA